MQHLAADMWSVRNWEFQQPAVPGLSGELNPLKLLRRRSSLIVDDRLSTGIAKSEHGKGVKPVVLSIFEEPSAESLLDSFNF